MRTAICDAYPEEAFLFASGFDNAIIGVDEVGMRLIYSVDKCIEILMQEMSYEDAMEYFDFNISGAYMGDKTPIWCHSKFDIPGNCLDD